MRSGPEDQVKTGIVRAEKGRAQAGRQADRGGRARLARPAPHRCGFPATSAKGSAMHRVASRRSPRHAGRAHKALTWQVLSESTCAHPVARTARRIRTGSRDPSA
ncbi:hypothetical protein UB46_09120 [Burkholderiaceae bacterium 16]|nr:hypothetical protein UB46_09120 [Burkholderiaceae bacterium 16]